MHAMSFKIFQFNVKMKYLSKQDFLQRCVTIFKAKKRKKNKYKINNYFVVK